MFSFSLVQLSSALGEVALNGVDGTSRLVGFQAKCAFAERWRRWSSWDGADARFRLAAHVHNGELVWQLPHLVQASRVLRLRQFIIEPADAVGRRNGGVAPSPLFESRSHVDVNVREAANQRRPPIVAVSPRGSSRDA